jgi:tetratricopeptide (TPR) repeat protein
MSAPIWQWRHGSRVIVKAELFRRVQPWAGVALLWVVLAAIEPWVRLRAGAHDRSAQSSPAAAGGLRALAANGLWLWAYRAWERQDGAATETLLALTCRVNPRPLHFWLNGARMMAYDLPHWADASSRSVVEPTARRERRAEGFAQRALQHLDEARRWHPQSAALWIETGNIHLHARGDLAAAAEAYRRAAEQPDAPHYASRVHAELLWRMGRPAEAHRVLAELHPRLQAIHELGERERAMPDFVANRIRELERELGITGTTGNSPTTAADHL